MRKLFIFFVFFILLFLFLGCVFDSTPHIIIQEGALSAYSLDMPGKVLSKETPYEIIVTENGCDVILHFINIKGE